MERNANRPADISGKPISLDESVLKDILLCHEVTVGLDFAVKINDRVADTSVQSFQQLSVKVLRKYKEKLNERSIPPIRAYYSEILKYSKGRATQLNSAIINLPFWQYSMHRIYAASLKTLIILNSLKALIRQAYIPNQASFFTGIIDRNNNK